MSVYTNTPQFVVLRHLPCDGKLDSCFGQNAELPAWLHDIQANGDGPHGCSTIDRKLCNQRLSFDVVSIAAINTVVVEVLIGKETRFAFRDRGQPKSTSWRRDLES